MPQGTVHRLGARLRYLHRVARAYAGNAPSQLTFWHELPEANPRAFEEPCGEYFQCFFTKADYAQHVDARGIPLLDYRGHVGRQYNPIAIAQWGLGNWNLYRRTRSAEREARYLAAADWLVETLEPNDRGVAVWKHHFDWEYRDLLRSGWYSALSQGQGVSLLCRAHRETKRSVYRDAARSAFEALLIDVADGGVRLDDGADGAWLEETIVDPPTHILNGFLWALWGVWDYVACEDDPRARDLLARCQVTLRRHLPSFDCGYWLLYEHSGTRLSMLASPFYHRLHISQLGITARLLSMPELEERAARWTAYADNPWCARRALAYKALFKALYY